MTAQPTLRRILRGITSYCQRMLFMERLRFYGKQMFFKRGIGTSLLSPIPSPLRNPALYPRKHYFQEYRELQSARRPKISREYETSTSAERTRQHRRGTNEQCPPQGPDSLQGGLAEGRGKVE